MKLLADTHAFLWFFHGDARLSKHYRKLIEDDKNQVFLSIASLWEIAIKTSIGKLELDAPFRDLVEDYVERSAFSLLPVATSHLIELERLPHHHRDPFDRLLIAQAIVESLPVITTDPKFDFYNIERI